PGPLGEVPSLGVHLGFNARPLTFFKLQVRFGVFQTSALGIVSHGISPRSILAPLQPSHTILSVSFPFVWSGQDAFRVSKAPASSKHAPLNMSSRTTLPRLKNVHSTDYIQIACTQKIAQVYYSRRLSKGDPGGAGSLAWIVS
ncbi:unnamed protein product, partial [Mycena citricolor]